MSPAPSSSPTSPTFSPAPSSTQRDVLVVIDSSYTLNFTSVLIKDSEGEVIMEIQPILTSSYTYSEVISLNAFGAYVLVISDSEGFGFFGIVTVYLGGQADPGRVLGYLDPALSDYSNEYEIPFVVDADAVIAIFPTAAPSSPTSLPSSEPSAPTTSPAPTGQAIKVVLVLQLDDFARETGFRLETSDGEVLRRVRPGSFVKPWASVIREYSLETDKDFQLVLLDEFGDGLSNFVRIYLESFTVNNEILAYDPNENSQFYDLTIPFRTSLPSGPISSTTEVHVRIQTDDNPLETGWRIADTEGKLLHLCRFGNLTSPRWEYETVLFLPIDQMFVFAIKDKSG